MNEFERRMREMFPDYVPMSDADSIALENAEKERLARKAVEERAARIRQTIEENIPERYREASMSTLYEERRPLAQKVIAGASGLVIGETGVGKTFFLCSCFHELAGRDMSVRYVMAKPLIDRLWARLRTTRGLTMEALIETEWGRTLDVLLIDEMDKMRDTEASFSALVELIEWRHAHMLPVVGAANGTPDGVQMVIPQAVYSRMTGDAEGSFRIMFRGRDRRRSDG